MSELISGKEALIALASGGEVEYQVVEDRNVWNKVSSMGVNLILSNNFKFRLKPRTIKLNGVDIPAPFEPKEGDKYYHLYIEHECGYGFNKFESVEVDKTYTQFGAWRTEEEIKQVVKTLRSVFKGGVE